MLHRDGVTLIVREPAKPAMDWNGRTAAGPRVAFVCTVAMLRAALDTAMRSVGLEVARVIVDRAGAADDFLDLLTALPAELTGDVLLIRDDGTGVLSATARGGDRVLYALQPRDVRFYLETNNLVRARVMLEPAA